MNLYEFGLVQKKYEEIKPKIENGDYSNIKELEKVNRWLLILEEKSLGNRNDGSQIQMLRMDLGILIENIKDKNRTEINIQLYNIEVDFRQLKMRLEALAE